MSAHAGLNPSPSKKGLARPAARRSSRRGREGPAGAMLSVDSQANIPVDTTVAVKKHGRTKRRKVATAAAPSKKRPVASRRQPRKPTAAVPGSVPLPKLSEGSSRASASASSASAHSGRGRPTRRSSAAAAAAEDAPTAVEGDATQLGVRVVSMVRGSKELAVPLRGNARADGKLHCSEEMSMCEDEDGDDEGDGDGHDDDDDMVVWETAANGARQPGAGKGRGAASGKEAAPAMRQRASSVLGPLTTRTAPPNIGARHQLARRDTREKPEPGAGPAVAPPTLNPEAEAAEAPHERQQRVAAAVMAANTAFLRAPAEPTMTDELRFAAEYSLEILHHMFTVEEAFLTPDKLLGAVTPRMLSILVDWLIEVQMNFSLGEETLYLAVNILHRYVTKVAVARERLQLVGAVCLLIASKHEEIYPPEVADFVYICADTYTRQEILEMECTILNGLLFRLCAPSPLQFLNHYARLTGTPESVRMLCQYVLELSLQEDSFRSLRPSHKAAGAFDLGCRIMNLPGWTPVMVHRCGYFQEDVRNVARYLNTLAISKPAALTTCRHKYLSRKYGSVAYLMYAQASQGNDGGQAGALPEAVATAV